MNTRGISVVRHSSWIPLSWMKWQETWGPKRRRYWPWPTIFLNWQRSLSNSDLKLFTVYAQYFHLFLAYIMILHTCVDYGPRMPSNNFNVNRKKGHGKKYALFPHRNYTITFLTHNSSYDFGFWSTHYVKNCSLPWLWRGPSLLLMDKGVDQSEDRYGFQQPIRLFK